jgi:hypothetical protein
MAGPKHQHFIPKSYLRNFADIKDDKAFVETMNIHSGEIKYPISLNDICVSKNIYTLPHLLGNDKYAIEKYYAENIDGIYPEVYKLLTDESIIEITEEYRRKILSTALSLYFRTSKFINRNNDELQAILKGVDEMVFENSTDHKSIDFNGKSYMVNKANLEEIKREIKVDHKTKYLINHLNDWNDFVAHKYHAQISVFKVTDEIPLITSDNPVDIFHPSNPDADIFDPNNSIQLPLDQRNYLWISPNTALSKYNMIYRGVRDKWFALTSNSTTHQKASIFVIGEHNTLKNHWEQLTQHNEETDENLEAFESIKFRTVSMFEFKDILEKHGSGSRQVKDKIAEMKESKYFADDPQMKIIIKQLGLE